MKATYKAVLQLDGVLKDLSKRVHKKYVKFHYALGRNLSAIREPVEEINAFQIPDVSYREYQSEQRKLLNKFARRDKNREVVKSQVPLNNQGLVKEAYDIADETALQEALAELDARPKFEKAMADELERQREYEKLLKQTVEFTPFELKYSSCRPQDVFNGIEMQVLLDGGILIWDLDEDKIPLEVTDETKK